MPKLKVAIISRAKSPACRGNGEGALATCEDALLVSDANVDHMGRDPAQPALIVQGHSKGFGLAQMVQYRPKVSKCDECTAYIEPEIDGLLKRLTTLREML